MKGGPRHYDAAYVPQDNRFPPEQLLEVARLANQLGGRGIPKKAIHVLCTRQPAIEKKLKEVPSSVAILDDAVNIPWQSITDLFELFRVPYVTIARYTKMLHKKRPNLIPILDSHVRNDYFLPTVVKGEFSYSSDAELATLLIKELRKDILENHNGLLALYEWQGKPFPVSIIRIFDILVWCRFGPASFRPRFADLYADVTKL